MSEKLLKLEEFIVEILGRELPTNLRKFAKRRDLPKKMSAEAWWELICVEGLEGGP